MLSVAPALANIAGAAAALSGAFAVVSVVAFSPDEHATSAMVARASGMRLTRSPTVMRIGAPRSVWMERTDFVLKDRWLSIPIELTWLADRSHRGQDGSVGEQQEKAGSTPITRITPPNQSHCEHCRLARCDGVLCARGAIRVIAVHQFYLAVPSLAL